MNTVKSFWYGWGALVVAGGGAYYFAKKQIDADRRDKYMKRLEIDRRNTYLESKEHEYAGNPSSEMHEPAPTRHEPMTDAQRISEKSKYEASQPYRSRRGDRFS